MAGNGRRAAEMAFGLAPRGEHVGVSWPAYLGLASWLREASGELPRQLGSFWRDVRQRWEEAVAAGKEAAGEAEDELRRCYQEAIQGARRRRR